MTRGSRKYINEHHTEVPTLDYLCHLHGYYVYYDTIYTYMISKNVTLRQYINQHHPEVPVPKIYAIFTDTVYIMLLYIRL